MPDPLLQIEGLDVHFRGPRRGVPLRALRGVTLRLDAGEALGVVGETGCGKSTLARAILGLAPVSAGRVLLAGQDLVAAAPSQRRAVRRRIGAIFQDPGASLDPTLSVARCISAPLASGAEMQRERVAQALAEVELPASFASRFPQDLSGGERQRVALARALVAQPRLLLADEPLSGLDPVRAAAIVALIARRQREEGFALLFISHDLDAVAALCQRVAVLYAGRIVESGTVAQVMTQARHPYTQALLAARLHATPGRPLAAPLGGEPPSPVREASGCAFAPRCPLVEARCRQERPALVPVAEAQDVACWLSNSRSSVKG